MSTAQPRASDGEGDTVCACAVFGRRRPLESERGSWTPARGCERGQTLAAWRIAGSVLEKAREAGKVRTLAGRARASKPVGSTLRVLWQLNRTIFAFLSLTASDREQIMANSISIDAGISRVVHVIWRAPEQAGMGDNDAFRRCRVCGGPVHLNGQSLIPVTPAVQTKHLPVNPAPDNGPESSMTPNERFARAIERRDALVRDRRIAQGAGRRSTDPDPRTDQPWRPALPPCGGRRANNHRNHSAKGGRHCRRRRDVVSAGGDPGAAAARRWLESRGPRVRSLRLTVSAARVRVLRFHSIALPRALLRGVTRRITRQILDKARAEAARDKAAAIPCTSSVEWYSLRAR